MRYILFTFILLISARCFAQEEDFQTWYGTSLKGEILNNLDVSFEPEIRMASNSRIVESWLAETDVAYSVKKWVKIGATYRLKSKISNPEYTTYDHRFSVYSKFDYKWHLLKFSYKSRLQTEYASVVDADKDQIPPVDHRHKVVIEVGKKKWFLKPFVGMEYYFRMKPYSQQDRVKRRISVGVDHRINKKMDIGLVYMRQDEFFVNDPLSKNIIAIGFSYELN